MSSETRRIRVMHIVDSLTAGGRERMAVNLANSISRERFSVYLCTTRHDGPLVDLVKKDVGRLRLERRLRFDVMALRRLIAFNQTNRIQILHAHDASLFLAGLASLFPPYPTVVWHDHYGEYATKQRPAWPYRLAAPRISGIIAVNQPLVEWSKRRLRIPTERIWYVPNFVSLAQTVEKPPILPGTAGARIVCVANFRAQKDHFTLLRALALVIKQVPAAHLLLIGATYEQPYFNLVRKEIVSLGLSQNVSLLENRKDVSAILKASDIGVLSSASEGLPLALLEYGMASLPVVATNVGQCGEVLDEGRAGVLVAPVSPEPLAEALLSLLQSHQRRLAVGKQLEHRVKERYSAGAVMEQVCQIYEKVLGTL